MMFRKNPCEKYRKLSDSMRESELSSAEQSFMSAHRESCDDCRKWSRSEFALNLLPALSMEPEISANFDERLLRKFALSKGRSSIAYWSPAIIGGAIACLALFAALQLISQPSQTPMFNRPAAESKLNKSNEPLIPVLRFESDLQDR